MFERIGVIGGDFLERLSSAKCFLPWIRHEHEARYRFAADFVPDKIVVDAACGEGEGSRIFAQSGASRVESFDVSREAILKAMKNNQCPNNRFREADCLNLPVADNFADVFVALETLEHLEEDHLFLKEVHRVLKLEGLFICSTPNRRLTNPGSRLIDRPLNPFHVREYNREEMSELLHRYFGNVNFFGQNLYPQGRVRLLDSLLRLLPSRAVARLNQCLKAPLFVTDKPEAHAVLEMIHGGEYEYLIAVCTRPLKNRI